MVIRASLVHYLHMTAKAQNERRQASIPLVGFEPTILVLEQENILCALDRSAIRLICLIYLYSIYVLIFLLVSFLLDW
jgi:hypothetical protein